MPLTEKMEVPYKLFYDPTLENKCLPIVGNLTFFPPLCNSNSSYIGIMNSFELTYDRRTNTNIIMPKTEILNVVDKFLYNPHSRKCVSVIVDNLKLTFPRPLCNSNSPYFGSENNI